MHWLTDIFSENEDSIKFIKIAREVLILDPSLDHIIKPIATERLHTAFYRKELTLDDICVQVYENQDIIDMIFFISLIQANTRIEPSDVILLFDKYKTNPSLLVFLQRLHFLFDKNQLKPNHDKKIFQ